MKTIKLSVRHMVMVSFFAMLILGRNVNAKGTETGFASSLEKSVDPELQIEEWMINDNYWNVVKESDTDVESEKSLNIENWMIDEDFWNPAIKEYFKKVKEDALKIDSWMINGAFWNVQK